MSLCGYIGDRVDKTRDDEKRHQGNCQSCGWLDSDKQQASCQERGNVFEIIALDPPRSLDIVVRF